VSTLDRRFSILEVKRDETEGVCGTVGLIRQGREVSCVIGVLGQDCGLGALRNMIGSRAV